MPLTLPALTLSDVQADIAEILASITGVSVIDMSNADYTATDEESRATIKVIVNSGGGTNVLTLPTTSDGTVPAIQIICGVFATNDFYIKSETGNSPLLINAPSPACTIIGYVTSGAPFNIYTSYISNDAYDASWDGSLLAPTKNAIFDLMYSKGRLLDKIIITSGTDYTPTAGTTDIYIWLQAGGGAGGSSDTAAVSAGAGGGGAAGQTVEISAGVDDATTYTIAIGAAGAAGAAGNNDGGDGGNTTITIDAVTYTAVGGKGGKGSAASTGLSASLGGASQNVTQSAGVIYDSGMSGLNSLVMSGTAAVSGDGGASKFGAGAKGRNSQGTGGAATNLGYGGGGAGGCTLNGGAATQGGVGAQGIIVIYEFDAAYGT